MPAPPSARRREPDPGARGRILDAFAARARRGGIRAVVMGDLARELHMSKKTLYQHFESKDALVLALVEDWGRRLVDGQRAIETSARSPMEFFRDLASLVVEARSRFSDAFWAEVQRDHPAAHARFARYLEASRRATRERVARHLRAGVERELALEFLNACVVRASDPGLQSRLGLGLPETLLAGLDVWARGALDLGSDSRPRRPDRAPPERPPGRSVPRRPKGRTAAHERKSR